MSLSEFLFLKKKPQAALGLATFPKRGNSRWSNCKKEKTKQTIPCTHFGAFSNANPHPSQDSPPHLSLLTSSYGDKSTHPLLPVHRILCVRSQLCMPGTKGPWKRVYYRLAPGSQSHNMAAVMKVNVSAFKLTIWPMVCIPMRKRSCLFGKNTLCLLGKSSRRHLNTLWRERERERALKARGFMLHKWPFHDALLARDSCWRKRHVVDLILQDEVSRFKTYLLSLRIQKLHAIFVESLPRWAHREFSHQPRFFQRLNQ